jgi:hypothetical protein
MRLRESWLFRIALAMLLAGVAVIAISGADPFESPPGRRGLMLLCGGYLLLLAAMYRAGVRMFTRGGVVLKERAPWTYRWDFAFLSIFGFGPLFISFGKALQHAPPDPLFTPRVWAVLAIAAGVCTAVGFVLVCGAIAAGVVIGIVQAVRQLANALLGGSR